MKSPSNRRQQQEQPRQKEFGELFTIHKPDLTTDSDSSENSDDHHQDEDPFHIRFDMTPEFPSHVPTPETIDKVENEQRPWIPRIFSGEDDNEDDITTARSPMTPTASRKTLSPAYSPRATRWGSDVWNPEVWNLLRTNTFESTSSTDSSLDNDAGSFVSIRPEIVNLRDTMVRNKLRLMKRRTNQSPPSPIHTDPNDDNDDDTEWSRCASPLQKKWMKQNALNLYSSCQQ